MKHLLVFSIALVTYLGGGNMSAQAVYTLPIAPEYINPNVGGGTPFISNVQHLSNYHMEDVEFYSKSPNEDSVYSDIQTVAERLAHGNYLIRYSNTRDNMLYVKKITKI